MKNARSLSLFIGLILFAQPLLLFAQKNSDLGNWVNVKAIAPGTKVSVSTKDGRSFSGTLDAVSDSDITVARKNKSDKVKASDISKVYLTDGGSRAKSIAIWAAIGTGVGAGAGAAVLGATGGSDETAKVLAPFIAIGAGIGAALGAALGGHKRTLVYEFK